MNIGILLTGISFGQDRDFRHCFENINRNLIEPLSQDNNVFVYITTYDHEYMNTLRDLYNPVKLEILNIHNTTQLTTRLHSLKLIKDESLIFFKNKCIGISLNNHNNMPICRIYVFIIFWPRATYIII